ncbi:MAG: hypothetical protein GY751_11945, partial [Bacteroidetes bacterium]|nr:hypothetical protein [Bacteroidota bacterium]
MKTSALISLKAIVVGVLTLTSSLAAASSVSWIDWTSTSSGSMTVGSSTVNVSMTGDPTNLALNLVNDDSYYKNYPGTYNNLAPTDLIRVNKTGTFTLTFSEEIVDPYISLVSVGSVGDENTPDENTRYDFSGMNLPLIKVISSGSNNWGYGDYDLSDNNVFTGREFNGILQLTGVFKTISFEIKDAEDCWHGFNIGTSKVNPVPIPAAVWLFGSGLLGLFGYTR